MDHKGKFSSLVKGMFFEGQPASKIMAELKEMSPTLRLSLARDFVAAGFEVEDFSDLELRAAAAT